MPKMTQYKEIFAAVGKAMADLGGEIYLVGGAVRDMLTSVNSNDLDFVVIGKDYQEYAKLIAQNLKSHSIFFKDNVRIPYAGGYIDVSAPRGMSIEEDLKLRDFTINNLAMGMDGTIIGDNSDLTKRRIVPVHDKVFDDDPVRILRGFRQAAGLKFTLSDEFLTLAKAKVHLLPAVAGERIYEELKKLCQTKTVERLIYEQADECGLWKELSGNHVKIDRLLAVHSRTELTDEKRMALYMAVLFTDGDITKLETLHPSKYVLRTSQLLLNLPASFTHLAADDPQYAAWTQRKVLDILLPYIEICFNLNLAGV